MKVLFLTLLDFNSIEEKNLYTDLMRVFVKNNHDVYIISPVERSKNIKTHLIEEEKCRILKLRIGNTQKTNIIEKGISTLLIESQFAGAIKKYFSDVKFDVVMYSTPPITFGSVINYIKKRDDAKSYLLLKDIFPQNAVDLGMFSKKSLIYKYFRYKEKQLYRQSDFIGCMSQANVDYVLKHNPYISNDIVHVAPNCIDVIDKQKDEYKIKEIRKKYNIPLEARAFIYGGNLGKPQGIPFLIECLKSNEHREDCFFVVCGTGTEYPKLKKYVDECQPENVLLINGLPKEEYEELVEACDIGLIFLDHRFTIPNFPSRILSYMQNSMPIIACTDTNTDVGSVITEGNFGWWCESDNVDGFNTVLSATMNCDIVEYKENAKRYLAKNYNVINVYKTICKKISDIVGR